MIYNFPYKIGQIGIDGNWLNVINFIEDLINIKPISNTLHDNVLSITFNTAISQNDLSKLNTEFNYLFNKTSFSNVEQIQKNWFDSSNPVLEILPNIENDLKLIYDNNNWNFFSTIEKDFILLANSNRN